MKTPFGERWVNIMAHAKANDAASGSGFTGLLPFLALVLGWLPASFGYGAEPPQPKKEE